MIGISLTAWPQSYYTGKVDFGNKQFACWEYSDAAKLINQGIKAFELEARYKNLSLINDSLFYQVEMINNKYNYAQKNYELSMLNNADKDSIIQNKDKEITILTVQNKNHKLKEGGLILFLLGLATYAIIK